LLRTKSATFFSAFVKAEKLALIAVRQLGPAGGESAVLGDLFTNVVPTSQIPSLSPQMRPMQTSVNDLP
jgi:hypothetical protein